MAFVQIGITALRAPDGTFLPSVPIYAEVPKATDEGLAPVEDKTVGELSRIFAGKFKQYIDGVNAAKG